ncbi:hemicentin-1-like [Rhopilema esculentum]|uniref:hemicentin-1-like n=1 Tax=Rhopilema esculentum TaxID=499914 RepID=UPI0031CE6AC0
MGAFGFKVLCLMSTFCSLIAYDKDYEAIETFILGKSYSPSFTSPKVMRHLADKVHTEGYDLDLPCKAIGAWPITYNWFINGHNFKRRFRVNVKNEGTLLRIQRIRARDAGVYTCLVSNKYGNLSFSFPLKIKETPGLAPRFYDIDVMKRQQFTVKHEGQTVRFRCEGKSDVPMRYTWLKNGKPLKKERRRIDFSNRMLRIRKLTLEDAANYTCVVNNSFGWISFSFTLNMPRSREGGPPRVTTYKKENYIKAKVGESVSLECLELTSAVLPYVSWYKWSYPVEKQFALRTIFPDVKNPKKWAKIPFKYISPKYYTTFHVSEWFHHKNSPFILDETRPYGLRLTLPNVTLADAGMYTCAASNNQGNDLAKLLLRVYL